MTNPLKPRCTHKVRLAYLVSHPIQYQTPLLRRIAQEPDIDLHVFFCSDFSLRHYKDEGFGVEVKWDVPLLDGYQSEFLPVLRDRGTSGFASLIVRGLTSRLAGRAGQPRFDALWIHGYSTLYAFQAMIAARMLGIPVMVRSDSTLRDRPRSRLKLLAKQLFFRGLRRMVSGVLTSGTLNAEYWTHYFGNAVPQFLMPHAVDNAFFQQRCLAAQATRAELQAELNLDPRRPVILFASKLQARKHCDHLIAAYARLAGGLLEPEPYLVIVGDGEERAALEAQAAATGFPSIRFCGFRNQSELPRFFDLASVFVLPARHEPWGLIVNEVMNAARPVILTDDIGCQPDLIRDGVEGCVYPAGDIAALEAALRRVLANPEISAVMGQHALTRIDTWSFEEDVQGLRRAMAHLTRKIPERR
jgi:glycosyltransferase involved in cell wall biosynthesis